MLNIPDIFTIFLLNISKNIEIAPTGRKNCVFEKVCGRFFEKMKMQRIFAVIIY